MPQKQSISLRQVTVRVWRMTQFVLMYRQHFARLARERAEVRR